jgi:hypothetical protein
LLVQSTELKIDGLSDRLIAGGIDFNRVVGGLQFRKMACPALGVAKPIGEPLAKSYKLTGA